MSLKYHKESAWHQKIVVENPTEKQLKKKNHDRQRGINNRNFLWSIVEERGGCEFCGVRVHPSVYHWHHIDDTDPNRRTLSSLIGRSTKERILEEAQKCYCLCPTCHVGIFHKDLCCAIVHRDRPDIASTTHVDGKWYEEENFKPVEIVTNPLQKLLK